MWFILNRHKFGEAVMFIGDNANVARVMGVNVEATRIQVFTLMGAGWIGRHVPDYETENLPLPRARHAPGGDRRRSSAAPIFGTLHHHKAINRHRRHAADRHGGHGSAHTATW
jgi:hypothetical protein